MTADNTIPAGHRRDARGALWAESQIKPIDRTRDELVRELWAKAEAVNKALREFKLAAFADIEAFVDLSANEYGVSLGGNKGNVQLLSFDGELRVQRAIAERIVFDERLQAAKKLIDECLTEWTKGARPEIALLVQDAFRVDSAGNIRTGNVLALKRLAIEDERWLRAMEAIGDAVQVVGSKSYIRFYRRQPNGRYQALSLDLSGV
ncbi:DUF3164 family protein [Rhodanobacter denitrificans]|uniref:Sulfate transporter n=1 Tax=Rhodanobacter denitrificans TaxID=666685 RepID=M4NG71_9GAMM|nr:DUF3164 family protein [Rhodanobacter denitrificans]AGG89894.1 Protein of unknown function (DUF3164) [Rhodanobacter denitrificans]UJM85290.1 DUF3164 family protein [Rhodanobacter denitrificans]